MPRKKRDIRRAYRRAGFAERQGKGDHTVFSHPLLKDNYAVDGVDGKDAKDYDEIKLRKALQELAEIQKQKGGQHQ
jgi:predicted RNA binding protein YcfA (HicA-like mRNA interferase family)